MSRLTREIFVERTRNLLFQQGSLNVSLSTVLDACEANKGSLYHFFPNGKEELLLAALKRQSEYALGSNQEFVRRSESTAEAISCLVKSLIKIFNAPKCPRVIPFSAVGYLSEGVSEDLRSVCSVTLAELERLYTGKLVEDHVSPKTARSLASVIVSTIEGAMLQTKCQSSTQPLKNAGKHLISMIEQHV